jgi:hypothetical protein
MGLIALMASTSNLAHARDDLDSVDVNNNGDLQELIERRPVKEYISDKAVKVAVGGTLGVAYNDNIYREANNETNDIVTVFRPGIRIKTDLKPYQLDIQGRVEVGEYAKEAENSYVDTDLQARLSYNIGRKTNFYVGGRHQIEHVAIGAFTDDPQTQAGHPTDYIYGEAFGGVKFDGDDWYQHLRVGMDIFDYEDTFRRDGNLLVNNDRDRNVYYVMNRSGVKLSEQTMLFAQATYNQRDYDIIDSRSNVIRDSDGYEGLVGINIGEKSDDYYLDLGVGFFEQKYDSVVFPKMDGIAVRGDMRWRPTDLWQIRGNIRRDVREANLRFTSGYVQSRVGVEVTHELSPEVTLGSRLRFTHNDFEANTVAGAENRVDEIIDGSFFADYNFYEDYMVGLEYKRSSRNSDRNDRDYDSNVALLRLGVRY